MSDNNSKGNEGEEEKELTVEEVEATKQLEKARKRAAFQKNQAKKLADHLYKDADVDVDVDVDVDEGGGDVVSDGCSNSASAAVSCNSTSGPCRKPAGSKPNYVSSGGGSRCLSAPSNVGPTYCVGGVKTGDFEVATELRLQKSTELRMKSHNSANALKRKGFYLID